MHDWRKRTRDPFETIYNWPIANEVGGGKSPINSGLIIYSSMKAQITRIYSKKCKKSSNAVRDDILHFRLKKLNHAESSFTKTNNRAHGVHASVRALPPLQPRPLSPRAGDELRSTWQTPHKPPRPWPHLGNSLRPAKWGLRRETRRCIRCRKEIQNRQGKESESCAARAYSTTNLPVDD